MAKPKLSPAKSQPPKVRSARQITVGDAINARPISLAPQAAPKEGRRVQMDTAKLVSLVPQVAVKEERRVLKYASDGLNGKANTAKRVSQVPEIGPKEEGIDLEAMPDD